MSGRIAFFAGTLEGGGAERTMTSLANGFQKRGIGVDLLVFKRDGPYRNRLHPDVRIINLNKRRALFSIWALVRYLRNVRPKGILSAQSYLNITAIWARWLARVPVRLLVREAVTISVNADNSPDLKSKLLPTLIRWFYPSANLVVAPSKGVATDLVELIGIDPSGVVVIPNPVDFDEASERSAAHIDESSFVQGFPIILGVGRLTAQKDFKTLIKAFFKVHQQYCARLVICGEGEDRKQLEKLAQSLGLSGLVAFPGFVENPFAYMRQSSVFVLSSRWEGLPNTLLEAMAVGTTVVATDCPSGPREILAGGRWGSLVPVGDADAMALAIVDALEGRLATPTRCVLEQQYGTRRIIELYMKAFELQDVACKPNDAT